nr:PAAR domain-containing protein [Robbsia andropogonis]
MIVEGDSTTNGGHVLEGHSTMKINERQLAFHGATVACPKCRTTGHIGAVGPYLPKTNPSGKQVALEGDVCLCNCNPPPRLIASQQLMSMTIEGEGLAQCASTLGVSAAAAKTLGMWDYIAFHIPDAPDTSGLNCTAYFNDGSVRQGAFDEKNRVVFHAPSGRICDRVEINTVTEATGLWVNAFIANLST